MKNFVKFFGMIALIAVIGFALVGCDNGSGGGGGGGEIEFEIDADHYGPDSSGREKSYIHLESDCSFVTSLDYTGGDYESYEQDFEITVDGEIVTSFFDMSSPLEFSSSDSTLITAGTSYQIQVKYTANSSRPIYAFIWEDDFEWGDPIENYFILKSFDTGVRTVVAEHW